MSNILPFFVVRLPLLGELPCNHVHFGRSALRYAELGSAERQLNEAGQRIADSLASIVPSIEDRRIRADILSLRRAVFNGSLPPERTFASLMPVLPSCLLSELTRFQEILGDRDRAAMVAAECFVTERDATSAKLADIARGNPDFALGVALSSPKTWSSFLTVGAMLGIDGKRSAKLRGLERTLLQYAVRAASRCTPFSRFAIVGEGRIGVSLSGVGLAFEEAVRLTSIGSSSVAVNFEVLEVLSSLMAESLRPSLSMPIRLNEHLDFDRVSGRVEFLVTRGKREYLASVVVTDSLKVIFEGFAALQGATVGSLVNWLHRKTKGYQSKDSHRRTIAGLIRLGMVVVDVYWDIDESAWHALLESGCARSRSVEAALIRDCLRSVRRARSAVERGGAKERAQQLGETAGVLAQLAPKASEGSREDKQLRTTVFEDCFSPSRYVVGGMGVDSCFSRELGLVCELASKIGWPRAEQATMRRYFAKTFGESAKAVPLMQFYRSYYQDHMKEHIRREEEARAGRVPEGNYSVTNPLDVPLVESIRSAHHRIRDLLRSLSKSGESTVTLRQEDLLQILADVPSSGPVEFSFSVFCHPPTSTSERFVVPGGKLAPGYGKYFSRFSDRLSDDFARSIRTANSRFSGTVAEIFHVQRFNANAHVPLSGEIVAYPNSPRPKAWPSISVGDLLVRASDLDTDRLELFSRRSGEVIRPVDLGFLSSVRRPPLFQLLAKLGPQMSYSLGFPLPTEHYLLGGERFSHFPRLNFGRSIVLSRRQWRIACADIPIAGGGVFDSRCHRLLLNWAVGAELPCAFYATFHGKLTTSGSSGRIERAQFFHLQDPLTSEYFARLVGTFAEGYLVLEEALPSLDIDSSANRPAELIVQCDRYPR